MDLEENIHARFGTARCSAPWQLELPHRSGIPLRFEGISSSRSLWGLAKFLVDADLVLLCVEIASIKKWFGNCGIPQCGCSVPHLGRRLRRPSKIVATGRAVVDSCPSEDYQYAPFYEMMSREWGYYPCRSLGSGPQGGNHRAQRGRMRSDLRR